MKITLLIVVCIIILILFKYLKKPKPDKINNGNNIKNTNNDIDIKNTDNDVDIKNKQPYYAKQYVFTSNEFKFYKELKKIADKNNMEIFCKMRLADIVGVKKELSQSEHTTFFNKIKSKHIDFVLLDNKTVKPILLVELDDATHQKPDRQERDKFINEVCDMCGIKILHTYISDIENIEKILDNALSE